MRVIHRILLVASLTAPSLLLACANAEPEGGASAKTIQASQEIPAPQASAALVRAEFDVAGMDCGGCVIGTRAALKKVDGVTQADATYDEATGEGTAWALYDPAKVTPDRLMAAIRELGYTPAIPEG